MFFVQLAHEGADFGAEHALHRYLLRRGDVNLESARPEGGRHFETDEARAQHDHAPRLCRARDDLPAIGERPQGAHMRQLRAGDLKPHGLGPGRQQQPIEFERAPVGERQPPRLRVKAFGDGAEP